MVFAPFKSRGSSIGLGPLLAEFVVPNRLSAPALMMLGGFAIAAGFANPAGGVGVAVRRRAENVSEYCDKVTLISVTFD